MRSEVEVEGGEAVHCNRVCCGGVCGRGVCERNLGRRAKELDSSSGGSSNLCMRRLCCALGSDNNNEVRHKFLGQVKACRQGAFGLMRPC